MNEERPFPPGPVGSCRRDGRTFPATDVVFAVRSMEGCGGRGATALPMRKRLNHRGPLSIDVSSAWYFITLCAAERFDYGRAVSTKPPPIGLPFEFVTDCVVWSAFADSNYAVSLRNVEYQGRTWQIEDRFLARWLAGRYTGTTGVPPVGDVNGQDARCPSVRAAHDALGAKLLPQIYSLGFLNPDVEYFT